MFQETEEAPCDQSTEHQAPTQQRVMRICTFSELQKAGLLHTDKKKQQKPRICNKISKAQEGCRGSLKSMRLFVPQLKEPGYSFPLTLTNDQPRLKALLQEF